MTLTEQTCLLPRLIFFLWVHLRTDSSLSLVSSFYVCVFTTCSYPPFSPRMRSGRANFSQNNITMTCFICLLLKGRRTLLGKRKLSRDKTREIEHVNEQAATNFFFSPRKQQLNVRFPPQAYKKLHQTLSKAHLHSCVVLCSHACRRASFLYFLLYISSSLS